MPMYDITVPIAGYVKVEVEANSSEDAKSSAIAATQCGMFRIVDEEGIPDGCEVFDTHTARVTR